MNKNTENIPVYLTICSALRDQIVGGIFAPGALLPSEKELCAKYNTTRETVRKGLKQLEQEGLIYSRPRRGYFVNSPRHNEFTMTFPEHLSQGTSRFKDIRLIDPDREVQDALQIPSGQKVIAVFRGNYLQEQQFGLEVKYLPYAKGLPSIESEINFAVFPDAADAKAASFSYYTQLNIQAVNAPDELLSLLGCRKEEPLLLISRIQITQSGTHIGYSKQYLRAPYGQLGGVSGYVQNKP